MAFETIRLRSAAENVPHSSDPVATDTRNRTRRREREQAREPTENRSVLRSCYFFYLSSFGERIFLPYGSQIGLDVQHKWTPWVFHVDSQTLVQEVFGLIRLLIFG